MSEITKKYSNGEITIVWKQHVCTHSTLCWKGLPRVFNPREKPWVKESGADTKTITDQIDKCPSGALSYYFNDKENESVKVSAESTVEVSPNGPLLIYGNVEIKHSNGTIEKKNKVTAFCRCGASQNKPYCDGSHLKVGFKG